MRMMIGLLFPGLPLAALAGLAGYLAAYTLARFLPRRLGFPGATLVWVLPATVLLFNWAAYLLAGGRPMEEIGLFISTLVVVGWSLGGVLGATIGRDSRPVK